ncbi:MAG: RimK family alpha-L-glutamate ligase [Thermoproteota archaeon]|nr:MAG: RimK family alpha-L-glutamate ligase [Candidatus Korarchaeota archaeon]
MKIGILVSSKRKRIWPAEELKKTALSMGYKAVILDPAELTIIIRGKLIDVIHNRTRRSLIEGDSVFLLRRPDYANPELLFYRIDVIRALELSGKTVINRIEAFLKAVDKIRTSMLLAKNGIPTPYTVVSEEEAPAMRAHIEFGKSVVKPIFGSQGKGSVLIENIDSAWRVFRLHRYYRVPIYVQSFVEHRNRDIRVFVLGERVLSAMYRVSNSWKTNISQGARPMPMKLTNELEEIALKSAEIIGADIAGVDIIESKEGPMVLEVNACPEWKGLQKVTKVNISEEIIRYVISKARR